MRQLARVESRRLVSVGFLAVILATAMPSTGQAQISSSLADTVRFLEQATFGPNWNLIEKVRTLGFNGFLQEQFAAPMTDYPDLPPMPTNRPADCTGECQRDNYTMYPLQVHFFKNALHGEDQLRQRVAFALSQILVVSGRDVNLSNWMRPYVQLLYGSAFGNYRQLLSDLTRNAAMGRYLDIVGSRCQTRTPPDVNICRNGLPTKPSENYARELLQLFSIGTELLHPDGTPVRDREGRPIPSYDQETVEELSRVLTGWIFAPQYAAGVPNYIEPLRLRSDGQGREDYHDFGPKKLLSGFTLPGGQGAEAELNAALDNIVNHPNTAPFISKQLIQHLVTSNPSPAYVQEVAGVFRGQLGSATQLREVVQAILLHPEARGDGKTEVHYGKLREPVLFMTGLLRAFDASSDGVLNNLTVAESPMGAAELSQDVFRPPSVFSFYSPDVQIAGTDPPLLGPPFQLQSSMTALRRANFANQIVFANIPRTLPNRPTGTSIDLSRYAALADDVDALLSELDRLLLHGSMSPEMRQTLAEAVSVIPASSRLLRARQAIYLIATSSQYQVQR
jgi:uncharacterized protein (DUF1800 family)